MFGMQAMMLFWNAASLVLFRISNKRYKDPFTLGCRV
jgi:hypothetical protein